MLQMNQTAHLMYHAIVWSHIHIFLPVSLSHIHINQFPNGLHNGCNNMNLAIALHQKCLIEDSQKSP